MEQQKECRHRASEIHRELNHVRPNHGAHSAFKRVEQRQDRNNSDGNSVACAKCDAHHFANRRNANSLRQRARSHEHDRRCRPHSRAKTLFEKLVGRVEFTLEVLRDQDHAKNHARDQIAQHELQKAQIAAERDSGR